MDQLLVSPQGDNFTVGRISAGAAEQMKRQLRDISSNAASSGVSDGEILTALSEPRDWLDPFGIFCKIYGTLMRVLGVTVTLAIALVGLVLVVRFVVQAIADLGEWLAKVATSIPVIGPAIKAMGWALSKLDAEQKVQDSNVARLTGATFAALIGGVVPAVVWGPINVVVDQLLASGAPGTGSQAPAGPPTEMAPGATPGTSAAGGASPGIVDKLYTMFKVLTSDGEEAALPEFTAYDINEIARHAHVRPEEVIRRLRAAAELE